MLVIAILIIIYFSLTFILNIAGYIWPFARLKAQFV